MSRRLSTAATLLALAALLAGCGDDSSAGVTGEPTTPATTATTPVDDGRDCHDVMFSTDTPVEPGRWCIAAIGLADAPYAVFDVPSGYYGSGPFLFQDREPTAAIGYWTVESVYVNPCTRAGGPVDPGPTVRDFAGALARQQLTTASTPVPVGIAGYGGLYVELTFPTDMHLSRCLEPTFDIFESGDGTRWDNIPGLVDSYWILDVDGRRLVLATAHEPTLPKPRLDELTGIIESVGFIDR